VKRILSNIFYYLIYDIIQHYSTLFDKMEASPSPIVQVHDIIQTMTHMMNYLSASLYESGFTKNHQDSYTTLTTIYDSVASSPHNPPSLLDVKQFYNNIIYLENVTYTDDPDYRGYKIKLRKYIISLQYK
jgi:hypothetical protein